MIKNKKIFGVIILLIIAVVILFIFIIISKKSIKKDYSFYKKTDKYEYKVNVKITKNNEIDDQIKKYVDDKISLVKEKTNYKLDFNSVKKEYKEIVTYDYVDLEYKKKDKVVEKHMVYNLKNNTILKLNDIFNDKTNYEQYIKDKLYYYVLHYSYQNNIKVDDLKIKDLNNFYIDQEGIHFYVLVNNLTVKKTFSYPELNEYINEEYKTYIGQSFEKQRTTRNIDNFKDKKVIAITFDDGPGGDTTNRLLDELDKRDIKVTFFVVGTNVSKYPDIIKRMYIDGHDIGSHTYNHANLTKLSDDEIYKQKSSVVELVNSITGFSPTLIRPPYGSIDNRVKSIYPMKNILWNVDSEDWKSKNVDMIYDEIMKATDDGDIVLLHDLYETSVDGALKSIDELLKQGYEFVTISELLQIKGDTKDTYYGF